jgi:hypothetical protein
VSLSPRYYPFEPLVLFLLSWQDDIAALDTAAADVKNIQIDEEAESKYVWPISSTSTSCSSTGSPCSLSFDCF